MVISHKHRFIFIHVWKTGGTSIDSVLSGLEERKRFFNHGNKPGSADFEKHITLPDLKNELPHKYFDPYFKFAFVRNPLSWEVSFYHFICQQANKHPRQDEIRALANFEDYIKWAAEHEMEYHSQMSFVYDKWGENLADFIGKYENLEDDLNKLLEGLDLGAVQLDHLNQSKHKDYLSYYSNETEEIVRTILHKDFECFGYQ